jgi:hypothetical protein
MTSPLQPPQEELQEHHRPGEPWIATPYENMRCIVRPAGLFHSQTAEFYFHMLLCVFCSTHQFLYMWLGTADHISCPLPRRTATGHSPVITKSHLHRMGLLSHPKLDLEVLFGKWVTIERLKRRHGQLQGASRAFLTFLQAI